MIFFIGLCISIYLLSKYINYRIKKAIKKTAPYKVDPIAPRKGLGDYDGKLKNAVFLKKCPDGRDTILINRPLSGHRNYPKPPGPRQVVRPTASIMYMRKGGGFYEIDGNGEIKEL